MDKKDKPGVSGTAKPRQQAHRMDARALLDAAYQGADRDPASDPRFALLERATYALTTRILAMADQDARGLLDDAGGTNDMAFLARVVTQLMEDDPFLDDALVNRLEASARLWAMLSEDGVYTVDQVADMLGVTPDAIRKRIRRGQLVGMRFGKRMIVPAWQFTDDGQVLPHFQKVLNRITVTHPLTKIRFFISPDPFLKTTPIEAIRNGTDLDVVERLASQLGHQVAR